MHKYFLLDIFYLSCSCLLNKLALDRERITTDHKLHLL